MKNLVDDKSEDFNLPKDIPENFFDIVSRVLDFVEDVDKIKND